MKATQEFKAVMEQLRSAVHASDDLQITVMNGVFQIHWRNISVDVGSPEDLVKAINAFAVIESLGAKEF